MIDLNLTGSAAGMEETAAVAARRQVIVLILIIVQFQKAKDIFYVTVLRLGCGAATPARPRLTCDLHFYGGGDTAVLPRPGYPANSHLHFSTGNRN